ncbi:focal adhesion kinase 1-like [Melitaea cinxia]|uniref:focal adhesion kinase 1-like n=1 Tax=Melitaea cinxia TaxID=113334 RepID=UPI001E274612|nr:focal adhesion kinase 1-like [Melitaea cinxia]
MTLMKKPEINTNTTQPNVEPMSLMDYALLKLVRDLFHVVQETVFSKKFKEKRWLLVKEESDLSSDDENKTERRIANLIYFFFTIVKSQKDDRKRSRGSCFKSETSPEEKKYVPTKVNIELENKMETLIEYLATTGCVEKDDNDDKKITLMEFLLTEDKNFEKPIIEINTKGVGLSESNVNVKNLTYINETPDKEDNVTLVEMLLKYMEGYNGKDKKSKSLSVTPSLSEKSKSDMTISKLETFSDMSKTKSDSTLTQTQDTVIDEQEDSEKRHISEMVIDLSYIKSDLEEIYEEAVVYISNVSEILRERVVINRKLGMGAFGTVYDGYTLRAEDRGLTAVAVKMLKAGARTMEKLDFLSETEAMKRFDHKNVVRLLAVITKTEPVCTVMKHMLHGDLENYLLARRHLACPGAGEDPEEQVSARCLTGMVLDTARAVLPDAAALRAPRRGRQKLPRNASHLMDGSKESRRSECSSPHRTFGVLLYEIVTIGSLSFQGLSNSEVLSRVKRGQTLELPIGLKPQLEVLIKSCWRHDSKVRPRACEVAAFLPTSVRTHRA